MITRNISYTYAQSCLDINADYTLSIPDHMSVLFIDISKVDSITASGEVSLIRALDEIIHEREKMKYDTTIILLHNRQVMSTIFNIKLMLDRIINNNSTLKVFITHSHEKAIEAIMREEMTRIH